MFLSDTDILPPKNSLVNIHKKIYQRNSHATSDLMTNNSEMNENRSLETELNENRELINKLISRMERLGLKPAELARISGLPQPTVHRIINRQADDPKLSNLRRMASAMGVSLFELEQQHDELKEERQQYISKKTLLDQFGVPIVNWQDIGNKVTPNRKDTICTVSHGPGTFASRLESPAMQAPIGPSYPTGTMIFVDPTTKDKIQHGDPVLIVLDENGRKGAAMRIYQVDGTDEYLMPLNIGFPVITRTTRLFEIVGKVIQAVI
jgi:SOS-response transcriptional repressor LexA